MDQFIDYIHKNLSGLKTLAAFMLGGVNYLMFPDAALANAAYAVGVCIILDIFTKFRAISKRHGGYMRAVRKSKISSQMLWDGTRTKLYSYLVVAILAGLAYRVIFFQQLSIFLGSVVYAVLFLRESQSIVENLIDAGAQLEWLLLWTKRKEKQILEIEEESEAQNEG